MKTPEIEYNTEYAEQADALWNTLKERITATDSVYWQGYELNAADSVADFRKACAAVQTAKEKEFDFIKALCDISGKNISECGLFLTLTEAYQKWERQNRERESLKPLIELLQQKWDEKSPIPVPELLKPCDIEFTICKYIIGLHREYSGHKEYCYLHEKLRGKND